MRQDQLMSPHYLLAQHDQTSRPQIILGKGQLLYTLAGHSSFLLLSLLHNHFSHSYHDWDREFMYISVEEHDGTKVHFLTKFSI